MSKINSSISLSPTIETLIIQMDIFNVFFTVESEYELNFSLTFVVSALGGGNHCLMPCTLITKHKIPLFKEFTIPVKF
jgi:hypothetical protein